MTLEGILLCFLLCIAPGILVFSFLGIYALCCFIFYKIGKKLTRCYACSYHFWMQRGYYQVGGWDGVYEMPNWEEQCSRAVLPRKGKCSCFTYKFKKRGTR